MTIFSKYLQTRRLKLIYSKTVTAAFHLNIRDAKRELAVHNSRSLLSSWPVLNYLGAKLIRSLTFHHHIEVMRKKNNATHRTVEATCGLMVGCRHKNAANNKCILNILHIRVLCTDLVSHC